MTTLAVTGHMDLTDQSVLLVRAALRDLLAGHRGPDLVGASCIARGSDSLFAETVLEAGGRLVAILPSRDYREAKVKPDHAAQFDCLIAAADQVVVMDHESANRSAYEDANAELLRRADRLVAVYDGRPPNPKGGGTADVVLAAAAAGLPVDRVWPDGSARL